MTADDLGEANIYIMRDVACGKGHWSGAERGLLVKSQKKKWSPESHHHKEMNSVSNLNGPERRSFPS